MAKTHRKHNRFHTVMVLFFVILALALALAAAILYFRHQDTPIGNPSANRFALQSITVIGNHHYEEAAIIGESGLSVGQSVFSVNKAAARKNIEAAFPYIATATVKSPTFNTIEIALVETRVIGAMYGAGQWLIVGENGKVLETMEVTGDTPGRYFYLQGASAVENPIIGEQAMDARSLRIAKTVLKAIETTEMEGILGVDMRDKTNIALNWKNQLTILLGSERHIASEMQLLKITLPQILARNGGIVSGRLDLSSYSDDIETNDRIIYTPQELLETP